MDLSVELDRRFANMRAAMGEHGLDALVVSGNEYSGFEGAVTYMSGFQIVHRYAYVVLPADGEPFIVFPTEARYVGEHATTPLEQVFHPRPGTYIADHARGSRLEEGRRLRPRLHHDRARLPGARRARSRPIRRRVRSRAGRQERGRARVGARLGADQQTRLRDLARGLRAGEDRSGGDGSCRGMVHQPRGAAA